MRIKNESAWTTQSLGLILRRIAEREIFRTDRRRLSVHVKSGQLSTRVHPKAFAVTLRVPSKEPPSFHEIAWRAAWAMGYIAGKRGAEFYVPRYGRGDYLRYYADVFAGGVTIEAKPAPKPRTKPDAEQRAMDAVIEWEKRVRAAQARVLYWTRRVAVLRRKRERQSAARGMGGRSVDLTA